MKYAAKKTWPERSQSWEHQGEAASLDAFALEFAAIEQLEVDVEFVVIEKEGDDAALQFFRVTNRSPYKVEVAEARAGGASSAVAPDEAVSASPAEQAPYTPNLSPVIAMVKYMAKVAIIAVTAITIAAFGIGYIKDWLA